MEDRNITTVKSALKANLNIICNFMDKEFILLIFFIISKPEL